MSTTLFAAATDVGRVRANNEDSHLSTELLWAVADGMGGHAGGEVASRLAVDAVAGCAPRDPAAVAEAFSRAHQAVADASTGELAGMGTTLVLACRAEDGSVLVGNVGDSRAYLLADGVLALVTTDDNEAEHLRARGAITDEQARVHPGRSVLTSSLGGWRPSAPEPAVHALPAGAGRLLLCSDGLNSELTDEQIGALLADGNPEQAVRRLVDEAVAAGGHDNVTVVVVDL